MDFYEGAYPASYERHSDTTFRKRYFSLRGRINRKRYLFRQLLLWLISVAASALLEPHFPASPVHMPAGVGIGPAPFRGDGLCRPGRGGLRDPRRCVRPVRSHRAPVLHFVPDPDLAAHP